MGRSSRNRHWLFAEKPGSHESTIRIAACGEEDSWRLSFTTDAGKVNCPKCASWLAQEILSVRPASAPKLELIKTARATYEAHVNREHRAYVLYEGAYGNGAWYVRVIGVRDNDSPYPGPQLDDRKHGHRFDHGLKYPSKEHALLSVPYWMSRGDLPTIAETKAAVKAQEYAWAVATAKRTQEEADDKTLLETTLAALSEIVGNANLSNFQQAGVQDAINRLTPKT